MAAQPAPVRRRPGDRLLDPLLDLLFATGHVERIEPLTPRMRLIRITGPELRGLRWRPGQQVRVHVKDPHAPAFLEILRDVLRTYSVWSYDGDALELCVLDHGDGPGARWARNLRAGDPVTFRGPEGGFTLDGSAPYHLFAGEETAAVAFGAMLRGLPDRVRVIAAVEVPGEQDRLPLPRAAEVSWQHRGDASAASSARLLAAVRDLDLPDEPGVAYLAGEARTCQAIRTHLVRDRGWPRRAVRVKPFWTPGRRGLD